MTQHSLPLEATPAYQAIMSPQQDTNLVFVSNILLGASFTYSAIQMNIVLAIIKSVQRLKNATGFRMSIRDFCKDTSNHNIKSEIKKEIHSLLSQPLHIPMGETGEDWLKINFISSAEYNSKEGFVEFGIDRKIMPLITNLTSEFTALNIVELFKVRSKHSKKLGMQLSRFRSTGVLRMSVEELKRKLGVSEKYAKFNDLKKGILEVAQKDFRNTSLSFDLKFHKVPGSAKIKTIEFILIDRTPLEKAITNEVHEKALKSLTDLEIRPKEARIIVLQVPLQEINRTIWGIKRNIQKIKFEGQTIEPGAYSWATFRNKYSLF